MSIFLLQVLTTRQNTAKHYLTTKKSSRYTGVSWHKPRKKWCAKIKINSKSKHLGYFEIEEDAAQAYLNELKKI